jgi:hypothetical protein
VSRRQPILSLSNSILVRDYKRTTVSQFKRPEIYQEGDIIVITNNSNPSVAGKRLIVGPTPRVNVTFTSSYHFRKGTRKQTISASANQNGLNPPSTPIYLPADGPFDVKSINPLVSTTTTKLRFEQVYYDNNNR